MMKIAPDDQQFVDGYLDRSMAEFETNPVASQLMRRMAKEFADLFVLSAMRYLDTNDESNAHRFLATLVLPIPAIFDQLSDPALRSLERAIRLLRRFLAIDPSFDVQLARRLPDRTGANHATAFDSVRASRTLDMLEETSTGRRLLAVVGHLHNSPDPRIRSRAVLFIGRRLQSPEWIQKQLERTDPRARANAIESIWGLDSPRVISLLEGCVGDENNRVAGNALVGLSLAKADGAADEIVRWSERSEAGFRATAAWIMGRVGDLGFIEPLQKLIRDDCVQVKRAALRAMVRIKRAEGEVAAAREAAEVVEQPADGVAGTTELSDPVIDAPLDGTTFPDAGPNPQQPE